MVKTRIGEYRNAVDASTKLSVLHGKISAQTVRNVLRKAKFKSATKKRTLPLTKQVKKDRKEFAEFHHGWTTEDWKHVVFSDETKINRLGSDGKQWTWFDERIGFQEHNEQQVRIGRGGNIKVWGCFTWSGIGFMTMIETTMNGELYRDILDDEFMKTLEWYNMETGDTILLQDNDPKHNSKIVREWLEDNDVQVFKWPSYSPDLNPIENLWSILKFRFLNYPEPPNSIHELWERVQIEWENITPEICARLVESMPERMSALRKAKGKKIMF